MCADAPMQVVMLATLAPAEAVVQETLATLNFASKIKKAPIPSATLAVLAQTRSWAMHMQVHFTPVVRREASASAEPVRLMESMRAEIAALKAEIESIERGRAAMVVPPRADEPCALLRRTAQYGLNPPCAQTQAHAHAIMHAHPCTRKHVHPCSRTHVHTHAAPAARQHSCVQHVRKHGRHTRPAFADGKGRSAARSRRMHHVRLLCTSRRSHHRNVRLPSAEHTPACTRSRTRTSLVPFARLSLAV